MIIMFSRQKTREIGLFQKYRKYRTLLQKYRILQDKQKNTGHYRKYRTATRTVNLKSAALPAADDPEGKKKDLAKDKISCFVLSQLTFEIRMPPPLGIRT